MLQSCKTIGCTTPSFIDAHQHDYCPNCREKYAVPSLDLGVTPPTAMPDSKLAQDFLAKAHHHMQNRAVEYDAPAGERSMEKTVMAFNALTGQDLSETEGWLFMMTLKMARSTQGRFKADNYEDLAAYASLAGESAARDE